MWLTWLSAAVVKVCVVLVGMGEYLWIIGHMSDSESSSCWTKNCLKKLLKTVYNTVKYLIVVDQESP